MPLVHLNDILKHANHHHYAVGAFGVVSLDFLDGVLQAAEASRSPVVLNLLESHFSYYDFDILMPAVLSAARKANMPVAVNFDHGSSKARAEAAIRAGCNGVMVDTSALPFSDNLWQTREVVAMAHACGVTVEGELGYVPGKEGQSAEQHPGELAYTSAAEAAVFVGRTGVDCLAVSIGTIHGRMKGVPKLDYARLDKIREATTLPLVIHGGSGLSDEQYRKLIAHGVAKINYYTGLADVAGRRIRANAVADPDGSYSALMAGVREAVCEESERCIRIWGSGGRAAEVLAQCRPWQEVEHVVLCKAANEMPDMEIASIMREGKEAMQSIPGVRNIRIGQALQADGKYHYCWAVTLSSQSAIEVFQNHAAQQSFARKVFLSVATEWIALDFAEIQPPVASFTAFPAKLVAKG